MGNALLEGQWAESVTVTRAATGAYVSGNFVPSAPSTLAVKAVVLPLEPAEIVALELGEHVKAAIKVYTETALITASDASGSVADLLTWQGDTYQVHSVAYRGQIPSLAHYSVTATRVEGT